MVPEEISGPRVVRGHETLCRTKYQRIRTERVDVSDETQEYDSLFGGDKLPSLFNKTHGVGTERAGIITKPPVDRQSRFFKEGGLGALKFFDAEGKPTDKSVGPDGKPNSKAMDTMFVLQTDYRLNQAELDEYDMDEDSGLRGVFASADMKRAIREAIKKSGAKKRTDLVGARLTINRAGKVPKGDYKGWKWEAWVELGVGPAWVPPVEQPKDEFDD